MKKKSFHFISCVLIASLISCHPKWQNYLSESGQWIDLSHAYDAETPYWPTSAGFKLDTVFEGMAAGGYYYSAYSFQSAEHGGTHIDAPIHFSKGKQSVDEIPLSTLIGAGIVIDVQDSARSYIDYQVQIEDFIRWEKKHGVMPKGSIVLVRTGLAEFWPNKKDYMGTDKQGEAALPFLHFPGLHPEAAKWLVKDRDIKAIGLDTPSIDYGRSSSFESHRTLFAAEIPAFENLANLSELPENGALIIALPMKIKGGSGSPLRIVAFVH